MILVPVSTRLSLKTSSQTYKSMAIANFGSTPSTDLETIHLNAPHVSTTSWYDDAIGFRTHVERGDERVYDVHTGSSISTSVWSGIRSSVVGDWSVRSHHILAANDQSSRFLRSSSLGRNSSGSDRVSASNRSQRSVASSSRRDGSRVGASPRGAFVLSRRSSSRDTSSRSSTTNTQHPTSTTRNLHQSVNI